MIKILFISFLMCFSAQAASDNYISPLVHLRKIKIRLTGSDPNSYEYRNFQNKISSCSSSKVSSPSNECVNTALKEKIKEYINTDAFIGTSVDFLHELLYLKPNNIPYEIVRDESPLEKATRNNSLDNLFIDIFKNNRSWDDFFTSGRLNGYNGFVTSFSGQSEVSYFSGHIDPSIKPIPHDSNFDVNIDNPDLAAGFMITPRFNSRYFNTPINEGRKRAAAILRVGLCDPMFPAIERGEEHIEVEDEIAKGLSFEEITSGLENSAALHGKRRDCMQCHVYRGLDHLAWTFRTTEQILAKQPTPGRFTYLKENGELIDEPVKGIGDFARKLTAQNEYQQCQVTNFWQRFVGNTEFLKDNPEELKSATKKFNADGGRVHNFIEYLLLHSEFRKKAPTTTSINPIYDKAKKVLNKCATCHRGVVPDFTSLPIGGVNNNQTEFYVERIIKRLGIKPYSSNGRTMPPQSSPWQPSPDEIKAIKDWVESEAPDGRGNKHLPNNWLQNLGGQQ